MIKAFKDYYITLHQTVLIMGESKIIVVCNQKGGAGKSTLCMLLANYLVKEFHLPVGAIIDTDFQKSIVKKREEDKKIYKGTVITDPYQVVSYSLSNNSQIPAFIQQLRQIGLTYIIDTPGSLNNNGVFAFLALADYIICPFNYLVLTLNSTTEFLRYWHNLKEEALQRTEFEINTKVILVPCLKPSCMGTAAEKELWNKLREHFEKLYFVAPEIPNSTAVGRTNTMVITPEQLKAAGEALNYIANIIYNPNLDSENEE